MKILHLNTNDISGGAARAAYRLHAGLRRIGLDSSMFVLHKDSNDPSVRAYRPSVTKFNFYKRVLRYMYRHVETLQRMLRQKPSLLDLDYYVSSRPHGYELFSDTRGKVKDSLLNQLPQYDILNLHWISEFFDYPTFFPSASQKSPIVWTLHDMNCFTGGCHYDLGCNKYNGGCGACPQLGSTRENDLSRFVWKRKQRVYSQIDPNRLHIVTPSQWLYKKCKGSSLLGKFPITVIPYGIDTEAYAPRNQVFAREVLGVPHDAKVIMFIAEEISNKRKGFNLLSKTLSEFNESTNLFLITLGSWDPVWNNQIPLLHLGQIHNERLQSIVYSASDILVIPSIQDNLPNTVMEALSCGIPVVGFEIGGIPDMVRDGITGLIVPPGDYEAIRESIESLLEDENRHLIISKNCRRVTINEYDISIQAKRYRDLYENMLQESKL